MKTYVIITINKLKIPQPNLRLQTWAKVVFQWQNRSKQRSTLLLHTEDIQTANAYFNVEAVKFKGWDGLDATKNVLSISIQNNRNVSTCSHELIADSSKCCNAVQRDATQFNVMQQSSTRRNTVQVWCNTVQRVMQHSSTRCNKVQRNATKFNAWCNTVQRDATQFNTWCNTVQWDATQFNTWWNTVQCYATQFNLIMF